MSTILMILAGGVSAAFAIGYLICAIHSRKHGKDKKMVSDELIELLKE